MLAIYCRTSKNKITDYSIETQQEGGIKFSHYLGIPYKLYIDEGKSGTLDLEDRASFAEMMLDIKSGTVTTVYCYDQSRIERNTDIWRFFVAECINSNCKFYPGGKELNLEDPESMLFANLLSLFNSFYAQITSRKVKLANYNKAKKGKTHGLKAYGYKRDDDNNYVVYEEEAAHVRRMFELSLQGIGTYTIANIFNDEGIPTKFNRFEGLITRKDSYTKRETFFDKTKVKWRGNVIYDMLRNEIYKGIRVWDDLRVPVPAIVSEELWQEVNENLSKNKKNAGKKAQYSYLLNGLIFCGHCQNEVLGKKRLKGNDNAYKCKGKRPPHKTCLESRGISLPKLETFIIQHLFYNKELKKLLTEAPKNDTESLRLRKELVKKEQELNRLKKQVDKLAKIIKDPDLKDDETFIIDYKSCKTRLKEIEKEIETLTIRAVEAENGERNKRSKHLIESYTKEAGFDEVKKLIHSIIDRIEISHTKRNKSGIFTIKIIYKYYGEYSIFETDWKAMTWHWLYHHRDQAMDNEDLEYDKEKLRYMIAHLAKIAGKNASDYDGYIKDFKGYETTSSMIHITRLKQEELLRFDYTT